MLMSLLNKLSLCRASTDIIGMGICLIIMYKCTWIIKILSDIFSEASQNRKQ